MCFAVSCGQEHEGHFGSVCILHLHKFSLEVWVNNQFQLSTRSLIGQLTTRLNPGPNFAVCLKDNYVLILGLDRGGVKMFIPVGDLMGFNNLSVRLHQL